MNENHRVIWDRKKQSCYFQHSREVTKTQGQLQGFCTLFFPSGGCCNWLPSFGLNQTWTQPSRHQGSFSCEVAHAALCWQLRWGTAILCCFFSSALWGWRPLPLGGMPAQTIAVCQLNCQSNSTFSSHTSMNTYPAWLLFSGGNFLQVAHMFSQMSTIMRRAEEAASLTTYGCIHQDIPSSLPNHISSQMVPGWHFSPTAGLI